MMFGLWFSLKVDGLQIGAPLFDGHRRSGNAIDYSGNFSAVNGFSFFGGNDFGGNDNTKLICL